MGWTLSDTTKDRLLAILDDTDGPPPGQYRGGAVRQVAFVKITDDPSGGSAPCVVSEFTSAATFADLTGDGIAYTADATTIKKDGHYLAQRTGDSGDGKHQWVIQGVLPFTVEVVTKVELVATSDPCEIKHRIRLDTFEYDASGIRVDSTRYEYTDYTIPSKCEEVLYDVACNNDGTITKYYKDIRVLDCGACP